MKKYKISEIAKIFNISRETLLFYDKIGILKPTFIDSSNKYRYYDEDSITKLGFILILKDSHFSLKEIKEYLDCQEKEKALKILYEKLNIIEKEIEVFTKAKKKILSEIEEINEISMNKNNFPFIEEILDEKVFLIPVPEPKGEPELQASLTKLREIKNNLNVNKRITIIKKENFLNSNFFNIEFVGYTLHESEKNLEKNSSNLYACIFHKKETKKIGESYQLLLNFIKKNNFKISGDSKEIFNDSVVNSGKTKGRIIKICIPISIK